MNKIICGDCLEVMAGMADNSVDLVVTDPPYGAGVADWDEDIPPQQALDEALRVSVGPVVWFGSCYTEHMAKVFQYKPIPERILIWNVSFSLSRATHNGAYYRWQPIYCWRLPAKTGLCQDVIREPTEAKRQGFYHPGMKPLRLMRRLVRGLPGDTILDPFMGSGTTGVACAQLGRDFIGIEIDPSYCDIARERLRVTQPVLL